MSNPGTPESRPAAEFSASESGESFEDILSQYEKSHSRKKDDGGKQIEGTVIAVSSESVFFDIGFKTEGIIPLAVFQRAGETVKPGDKMPVYVKGRDPEGYYELSRRKIARPTDWSSLEKAFAEKATMVGTVTGVVKGGFSVDIGVRAFMPASRSGVRDASEMEKLVGQEIRCRIIKLDATEEDVVVDRRALARRRRARREGTPLFGDPGRRDGAWYGPQPYGLRRFCRSGRRRWPASRGRDFLEPNQQTRRRSFGGAADRSQGAKGGF